MHSQIFKNLESWITQHEKEWLNDYFTFLRFRSVSSEAAYQNELMQCHDWLCDYIQKIGFEVESWPTPRHPIIFASNMQAGPEQPTLLIYNHYDVQPVDPIDKWVTPPFEPSLRDGEIYARGAQDNKGQCFYVLQALKALKATAGQFPINIKLCIEGEEEIGSGSLSDILLSKKKDLKADYLAIVDMGMRKPDQPALTLGIRGILTMDVEVEGSRSDLHSGMHGGIAYNPIHALVRILTSLRDDNGKILIPGFYDDVISMTEKEKSKISFSFNTKEYNEQIGASSTGGEQDYSPLERAWIRPALEINGIYGGYCGDGFKTVIPAKAHAKISCRLVPDQDPDKIGKMVMDYLISKAPAGMKVSVVIHPGKGRGKRISPESKCIQAFAQAFQEVFDTPCEYILSGGSIPVVPELTKTSGAETILLGLGLPTDQIHAPNEHFGLTRLKQGMLVMARVIQILKN